MCFQLSSPRPAPVEPARPAQQEQRPLVDVVQLWNQHREQPLRHDKDVDEFVDELQQRTSIGTEAALSKLGRLLTPLFLWSVTSCCTRTGMSKPCPRSATAKSPRASEWSGPWPPVVEEQTSTSKMQLWSLRGHLHSQDHGHLLDLHGLPHGLPCGYMPQPANHALHTRVGHTRQQQEELPRWKPRLKNEDGGEIFRFLSITTSDWSFCVLGMESVSRPGSLQVAGALIGVGHRLLVRWGRRCGSGW